MFEYDAFVSYRRGDGGWHARTLRHRLLDVRLPVALTAGTTTRRLRIYLDQIYERATDDFFEHTIKPALRHSRHLVIVQSASAMDQQPDGTTNWLEREIDYFRSLPADGRSLSVAVTSGDLSGPLPASLLTTHPNIERLDLRAWRWYRPAGFDEPLLSLAATLHDISPADMPALRREDARRRAAQWRRRALAAGIIACAFVATALVALWQYGEARLETERRNIAQAGAYWDRLDFADMSALTDDELNALWEIASGDPAVRAEFLNQLLQEPLRATRLGRGRGPILRSLFLRWPSARAGELFDTVLAGLSQADRSERVLAIGLALDGLASVLPAQDAEARLGPLLARIGSTTDDDVLAALSLAGQALAGQLPAEPAQRAFTSALDGVRSGLPERASAELTWIARQAAGRVTAEQAQTLFAPLLQSLRSDSDEAVPLRPYLSAAVSGFADKLKPAQARAALTPLIRAMRDAGSEEITVFATLIGQLAPHATSAQARAAAVGFVRAIVKIDQEAHAFRRNFGTLAPAPESDNQELFANMRLTLMILAARLQADDALVVLDSLTTAATTTDAEVLDAIDVGAAAVARRVADLPSLLRLYQVRDALFRASADEQRTLYAIVAQGLAERIDDSWVFAMLLQSLRDVQSPDWRLANAFALPAQALARRSAPDDAMRALEALLKSADSTPSDYHWRAVGILGQALAERVGAADARRLLPSLVREIQRPGNTRRTGAFAAMVRGMSARVTPAQAEALFPSLLTALLGAYNEEVESLSGSLAAVAPLLTDQAARRLFPSVLKVLADSGTSIGHLSAVSGAVEPFIGKVDAASAASAVQPLLRAIQFAGDDSDRAHTLAAIKRAASASGGLAPEHLRRLQSEIAWAAAPAAAELWAHVLVEIARRDPPEGFLTAVVTALKSPPSAGGATSILLDGLRAAAPQAPGAAAGLPANLAWIGSTFPHIDISGPPVCPPPPRGGLRCPTPVRADPWWNTWLRIGRSSGTVRQN